MKTLDRYVIRSFLLAALLLFIGVMALRIVADLFLYMDEFLEGRPSLGQALAHMGSYYGCQSLVYFAELGGVIIVAAATFTLAWMNKTNELTAMLASGVSLHRVILPMVVCAMLLGGLVILDRELLIPPNAARLVRSHDEAEEISRFPVRLMPDGRGTIWFSTMYDPPTRTMASPVLVIRDAERKLIASVLGEGAARPTTFAGQAGWSFQTATLSRAGEQARAWRNSPTTRRIYTSIGPAELLEEAKKVARRYGATIPPDERIPSVAGLPPVRDAQYGLTITASPPKGQDDLVLDRLVPGRPRGGRLHGPVFTFAAEGGQVLGVFHARSAAWVPPQDQHPACWELEGGELFYPSDLTHDDLVLRQSSRWLELMSSRQISELLKLNRVGDRQAAELARHVRFADPINNLVMLLLGLPFVLSRERNIKASAGLCLLMVGSYFAFVHICRLLGLHPMIAAFLPIGLFGTVAVIMLDAVKT